MRVRGGRGVRVVVAEGGGVLAAAGVSSGSELMDGPWHAANASLDPAEDLAILPFSSGTTGPPKGVMLTHTNMVANLVQSSAVETYKGDTFISILPMYHIYGAWAFLSYAPYWGATTAVLPKFDITSVEVAHQVREEYCREMLQNF